MKHLRRAASALLILLFATVPVFADIVGPFGLTPGTLIFIIITVIAVIIILAVIAALRRMIKRRRYLDGENAGPERYDR